MLRTILAWNDECTSALDLGSGEALLVWIQPSEFGLSHKPFVLFVSQGRIDSEIPLNDLPWIESPSNRISAVLRKVTTGGRCIRGIVKQAHTTSNGATDNIFSIMSADKLLETGLLQSFWNPIDKKCHQLGIRKVHLVTTGDLHLLPWQGYAPSNIDVHVYPGLFGFMKKRNVSYYKGLEYPTPDHPILVIQHSAHDEGPSKNLYCISLEVEFLKLIWGENCVEIKTSVRWTEFKRQEYTSVFLAGHGEIDSGGFYLGSSYPLRNLSELPISFRYLEVSACLLGRVADKEFEPSGLVISALRKSELGLAIGALLPIDDFLAVIRTLLCHVLWRYGRTTNGERYSLLEAAKQSLILMESGEWPEEAISILKQALESCVINIADSLNRDFNLLRRVEPKLFENTSDLEAEAESEGWAWTNTPEERSRDAEELAITKYAAAFGRVESTWQSFVSVSSQSKNEWRRLVNPIGGANKEKRKESALKFADEFVKYVPSYIAARADLKLFTKYWVTF